MATVPLPAGAELTVPPDGWRPALELVADELEVSPAVDGEAVELDAEPGMVAALMPAKTATAATAAAANQKVSLSSRRIAASRLSMRVVSMLGSVCNATGTKIGTGEEFPENPDWDGG